VGQLEKDVIREILTGLDPERDRLFRINAGMGWTGKVVKKTAEAIILANPRPLHAAPPGWPDLFGWSTVEITPSMVGMRIAVAHAVEVKAGKDRMRPEQQAFRDVLERMGGIYEVRK
jgi:hypothetical protein